MARPAAGERVGPYRLLRELGWGGMGVVYLAVSEPDGAEVALKLLRSELAEDETFVRRFEREARIARGLDHPNLAPVLDAGEADGRWYLAARYVEGETLATRTPLSLGQLLRLAGDVGSALDELHRRGLVHRDVKPANIILASSGEAVLTDFGLARGDAYTVLTRTGQLVGTVDYLAPELIRGADAAPASDLYALGCVLYECAAGAPPFAGFPLLQAGIAHLQEEPADPCAGRDDLPAALCEALLSALAKDPANRPASGAAYADALRRAAAASLG